MIDILVFILCFFSVLLSLLIVTSKNPIYAILFLILVFCDVTFIFIIMGVEFVAITFLIVYVGAIAVLFLFVVMMLNIKILELDEIFWKYLPIGLLVSILFVFQILSLWFHTGLLSLLSFFNNRFFYIEKISFSYPRLLDNSFLNGISFTNYSPMSDLLIVKSNYYENNLFFIMRCDNYFTSYNNLPLALELTNTEMLGWIIYTYFFFIFLIISLILLVAMIGSIVLVLNQNINVKRQLVFRQTLRELKSSIYLKR